MESRTWQIHPTQRKDGAEESSSGLPSLGISQTKLVTYGYTAQQSERIPSFLRWEAILSCRRLDYCPAMHSCPTLHALKLFAIEAHRDCTDKLGGATSYRAFV